MFKSIKIRIYPNNEQEIYINKLLGCYRFVYNKCLEKKQKAYKNEDKLNLGLKELSKYFYNDLRKSEEYIFLKEHNTKVLTQSIINMLDAYKRFFVNGSGFPKFKSKKSAQSCRFSIDAISNRNDYGSGKLTLTKSLKNIKFKCSDKYKQFLVDNKLGIRSATLSKTKTDKYFLYILVECVNEYRILPESDKIVGIDLGIKDFIVTSDGDKYENIKSIRNNEEKLVKLHKRLSKKQRGSKNRNKARKKLARKHERITNQKQAYLHKVTNELLNDNQIIVMENLNVKGMIQNKHLAKSISELSLGDFKTKLLYKAEWSFRNIVIIDRFFPSSKLCSECGYKNKSLTLKDREWACPECSVIHDRDINAALNIKNEGIRILNIKELIPIRNGKFKPVDYPTMDEPLMLKSSDSRKQEIVEDILCIN